MWKKMKPYSNYYAQKVNIDCLNFRHTLLF